MPFPFSRACYRSPGEKRHGASIILHGPMSKAKVYLTAPETSICLWASVTSIVLFINIALTILASVAYPEHEGLRILFEGQCSKVSNLDKALHVIINMLSVLLLTASNYTMQYLSSPTRKDLDRAHSKGQWLDVGVPTMRNLTKIDIRRSLTWFLLALTSVPLAILYNSIILDATDSNNYDVFIATEDFLNGADYDRNASHYDLVHRETPDFPLWIGPEVHYNDQDTGTNTISGFTGREYLPSFLEGTPKSMPEWTRMSNKECIHDYSARILTGRKNLFAITNDESSSIPTLQNQVTTGSLLFYNHVYSTEYMNSYPAYYQPFKYLCSGFPQYLNNTWMGCSPNKIDPDNWNLFGYRIQYCLSEPVKEHCRLQFNQDFSIAVIVCNAIKVFCMLYAIKLLNKREVLATQGDVLQSFLTQPDPYTMQSCLLNKSEILSKQAWFPHLNKGYPNDSKAYKRKKEYWFSAASRKRWIFFLSTAIVGLAVSAAVLHRGLQTLKHFTRLSFISLWNLGFGRVDPLSVIYYYPDNDHGANYKPNNASVILLLANLPQLLVSVLYLNYNSLFTCMLMEKEWNDFAYDRKALRVSSPLDGQRSTYFLSLPYGYAIPLIVLSGLMHWLVSQSIFLAQINPPASDTEKDHIVRTFGYSCIGIVFVLIVGSSMLLIVLFVGARRYRPGMPLAAHCSAVLSAACQRLPEEKDMTTLPLKWGVVSEDGDIQHCTLSSLEVQAPKQGDLYR